MDCVILANGSFPKGEPLRVLHQAGYICCCDGAVEKLLEAGFVPDVIVGDGDSVSEGLKSRFADIFVQIAEQECNDLTKAVRHCMGMGYREITILGATGLREDHTLGNIFLLPYYLESLNVKATMVTDEGLFVPCRGASTLKSYPGQQVSIFNINCTRLSAQGLKWPIRPFSQLWQGTLNEALTEEITIEADGVYLVFRVF